MKNSLPEQNLKLMIVLGIFFSIIFSSAIQGQECDIEIFECPPTEIEISCADSIHSQTFLPGTMVTWNTPEYALLNCTNGPNSTKTFYVSFDLNAHQLEGKCWQFNEVSRQGNGYLKLWNGGSDKEEITYGSNPYAITPSVYIEGEIPVTIDIEYNVGDMYDVELWLIDQDGNILSEMAGSISANEEGSGTYHYTTNNKQPGIYRLMFIFNGSGANSNRADAISFDGVIMDTDCANDINIAFVGPAQGFYPIGDTPLNYTVIYTPSDGGPAVTETCDFNINVEGVYVGLPISPTVPETCAENDGSVSLTVFTTSESTPEFYYTFDNWATQIAFPAGSNSGDLLTIDNLSAGTYNIQVKDISLDDDCQMLPPVDFVIGGGADSEPPVALCKPVTVQLDESGSVSITAEDIDNGSTDDCGIASLSVSPKTFNCDNIGQNTVELTVTDKKGNISTCTTTVTVEDNILPVPNIANLSQITSECDVTVTPPTATDNCSGTITATTTDPLSYTEEGNYTITWTYDDGNGNSSSQTQTVLVDDISAPVADITILPTLQEECSVINIQAPTATDNCEGTITATTTDPMDYTEQGIYTITWIYDDGNGNTSAQNQTVIVNDVSAPVANIADLPNLTGECSVTVISEPTAMDNCAGTITATTSDPLSYSTQGTYSITWTYDDGNGNTSLQIQTVIVNDVTSPLADVTELAPLQGECSVADITAPTATDNCEGTITASTSDPLSYNTQGTYSITWTYDDGNGNTSLQNQTVIVDDLTPPLADVPDLPILQEECAVTDISAPTAMDNCVGIITASTSDPLSYSEQGTYSITWTYNDGNGNTSSQIQTVIVDDVTPPLADVTELPILQGECSVVDISAPAATDNCEGIIIATTSDPLSYNIQGSYTITWTYDDGNGNTSTQTQTVIVDDMTPPVADVTDLPILQEECAVSDISAPIATDNCEGTVTATTTDPLSYTAQGTYFITWTYDDGNGNTSTQIQTVIVDDVTPPVADVTDLPILQEECAIINISAPTATDNCEGTITATTTDPISYTAQGIYTVTWTYDDGNGNISTQNQTVILEDVTVPVVPTAPEDVTVHCIDDVPAPVDLIASDNCNGDITISPTDVVTPGDCDNNYLIIRTWTFTDGSGNTSSISQTITVNDDIAPFAPLAPDYLTVHALADVPLSIDLTAVDNCSGEITVSPTESITPGICENSLEVVRTWTFTDDCGNTSSISQTIFVNDDIPPVAPEAPADITVECESEVPAPEELIAADNDGNNIVGVPSDIIIQGSCSNNYSIIRTWTFTDGCRNISIARQTITVNDDIAPVAPNAPEDITVQCTGDVPVQTDITATDNCMGDITVSPTDQVISGSCENSYSIIRTWTFTDGCENTTSISQTITVNDDIAPIAPTAPEDITVQCAGDVPALITLTAIDNCNGDITVSPTEVITQGDCENSYSILRTWTFTDGCGNTSSVSQTINVIDDIAPVTPTAPENITVQCAGDVPALIDLTAIDNCSGDITVSPVDVITPGDCENNYSILRTWTFTDGCGNTSSVSQTINVNDDIAPVAPTAPENITVQCAGDVPALIDLTAIDNCDGDITVSSTDLITPGDCENSYSILRSWTFTDGCENTCSISQTITVNDDVAPVAPVAPEDVTVQCIGDVPVLIDLTAIDNCSGDITVSPVDVVITSGDCENSYSILRTWTFTDGCENTSSISQTITVNDDVAPVAPAAPEDVTVQCIGDVPVLIDLTAIDNCSGDITVSPTEDVTPGGCENSFTIIRTWTFTDDCGNTSSVSQTINVNDDIVPVAPTAPENITVQCIGDLPAQTDLTATDNCNVDITVSPTDVITPGNCANNYDIIRTWTFADGCGNTSSISQTITVVDDIAPVTPTAPENITVQCIGDVPVQIDLTATDNCNGDLTVSPTDVVTPGGDCENNYSIIRTWTFTDGCGNTSSVSQTITVDDDIAPIAPLAPDYLTVHALTDVPVPTDLIAVDNCSGEITVSPTESITPGICENSLEIVRTWTFTDDCGNTSSISQTIFVNDDVPPVAPEAPADITVQCESEVPAPEELIAEDNDGNNIVGILSDITVKGSCSNNYSIVRTWTFTDGCGNISITKQTITVNDDIAPVAPTAPENITVQCTGDVPAQTDLTATDNCMGDITVSPTDEVISGSCENSYSIIRTWTFTDGCGNISTAKQTINVNDNIAPIWDNVTGELDANLTCADTEGLNNFLAMAPTATDNCSSTVSYELISDETIQAECEGNYTIIRKWTASDNCGNTSPEYIQTITYTDKVTLTVSPTDVTCNGEANGRIYASANCGATITVNGQPYDETTLYKPGTYVIVATANDNGEVACTDQTEITITTVENTPPIAVCKDITIALNSDGNVTLVAAEIDNGSSDECGIDTMWIEPSTFNCDHIGENMVTLTVIDNEGVISTCQSLVTVEEGDADCTPLQIKAANDMLTLVVCSGSTVTGNLNILDNDKGFNSDEVTITVSESDKKSVQINTTNGSLTYSNDGYFGNLTFTYTICETENNENCDQAEITIRVLIDSDCDGVADEIDIDDDNDGIVDVDEGDGNVDTDEDGIPDSLDIDSDNDGITDNVEWQEEGNYIALTGVDTNANGWDDAYDGQFGGTYYPAIDTDNDYIPDYLDEDSDEDGILDYIEGSDANSDTIADVLPTELDSDMDGLDDAYDIVDGWSNADNSTGSNAPLQDSPVKQKQDGVWVTLEEPDGIRDWRDPDMIILPPRITPCDFFIPNAFSPNSDGINDYFFIDTEFCPDYEMSNFEVYNRWGILVYEKENYGNENQWGSTDAWWDGRSSSKSTAGNKKLPPATYFYILQFKDGTEPRTGSIFLSN